MSPLQSALKESPHLAIWPRPHPTMKPAKLNILHLIGNLKVGGAQEVVRTLVDYQAQNDCRPVVCTFEDGPLRAPIESLGIPVIVMPPRRHSVLAFPWFIVEMVQYLHHLTRLVKKYQIDVVQTHILGSLDFLIVLLRLTTPVRVIIWTFHSAHFDLSYADLPNHKWLLKPKIGGYHGMYRLLSRLVSRHIAVSDPIKRSILKIIPHAEAKVSVIYNGVDMPRYGGPVDRSRLLVELGLPNDAYVMVMVGHLEEQKAHHYMVEAMARIVPAQPRAHILFIGGGRLRGELEAQVSLLKLTDHVHFLGIRRDTPALLAAGDLFLLPSLWEGLSMALLEAMATGLPIVASAVSGTVQAMTSGQHGILIPSGDIDRLTEAVIYMITHPDEARAMGAFARQRVAQEFSAQRQAKEHIQLYLQLLD